MDINLTNPVTTAKIGEVVNGASAATPNDTDLLPVIESSVTKKLTLTNLKAFLKTYFDTLYSNLGYTAENVANKSSSYTLSSTTTYANTKALVDGLATKEPLKGSDDNYVTDAQLVVIGNTSGTNSGDNATNSTSNTYADGKIADSITNGVTTIAPSQNAVFDALALKADSSSVNSKIIGVGYFDMTSFNPLDATLYYSNPINNLTWSAAPTGRHGVCDVTSNNQRHKVIFWNNGTLGTGQQSTLTFHNLTQLTSEVLSTGILLNSVNNAYYFTSTLDMNPDDLYYYTLNTGTFTTNPTTIFTQIISQFLL